MNACVCSLTEEQLWWRPNEASNSIGNLLLHLNGNLGQGIVAPFNRKEDARNRPLEFSERGPVPVGGLLARLAGTVEEAGATLARLTPADLEATYEIQGNTVTGLYAVYRSVEHFAMHYGQIAYIVRKRSRTATSASGARQTRPAARSSHPTAAPFPLDEHAAKMSKALVGL